jgi:membrane protein YqaA with SNARE-associated domain
MAKFTVILEMIGPITKPCSSAIKQLASARCLFVLTGVTVFIGAISLSAITHGLALPYFGLFVTSLVAGTIIPFLPGSSEMTMAALLATKAGEAVPLIATAIVGNVVGATTNYVVGSNAARFSARPWFPISTIVLQRTTKWFNRYGIWLLLMCWLPTAGDAITLVAGLLRADLRAFLLLTTIGKAFGHIAVASGVNWIL